MAATVGVLALQGAFREHCRSLARCGAQVKEIRQRKDLSGVDAVILPGGESTTIGKLLITLNLMEPLKERIRQGMPVYGSCAGLILLCARIEGQEQPHLGVLDATVRRNAFGRQIDSFETDLPFAGTEIHAVFIRAPFIIETGPDVSVLSRVNQNIVAVRQKNILATSFHPELTPDLTVHQYFLSLI